MDCSLPGSSVHGILQARMLERVAIRFSRGPSHPGIKPASLTSSALAGDLPLAPPGEPESDCSMWQKGHITDPMPWPKCLSDTIPGAQLICSVCPKGQIIP